MKVKNINKREIVDSVEFENGKVLSVGDYFVEGYVINLDVEDGMVGVRDGEECWGMSFDDIVEEDFID